MHLTTVLTSTFVFASAALALPTSLTRRQTLDCSCEIDRICNPQLTAPQAIQIYSQNQAGNLWTANNFDRIELGTNVTDPNAGFIAIPTFGEAGTVGDWYIETLGNTPGFFVNAPGIGDYVNQVGPILNTPVTAWTVSCGSCSCGTCAFGENCQIFATFDNTTQCVTHSATGSDLGLAGCGRTDGAQIWNIVPDNYFLQ